MGTPRPRWGALYAIVVGAAVLYVAGAAVVAGPVRIVLASVVVAVAGVAAFGWVAGNRVALHQVDWCRCASATVRMRVIDPATCGATLGAWLDTPSRSASSRSPAPSRG